MKKLGNIYGQAKENYTKNAETASAELTFSYQPLKKPTNTTYPGIVIKNAGEENYQIVIAGKSDLTNAQIVADTKTYKPTAVKAGKEVKLAASKTPNGQFVYARYASEYMLIGVINLDVSK